MALSYLLAGTGGDGRQLWIATIDGQTVTTSELATLYGPTDKVVADPSNPGRYILAATANDANPTEFTDFGGGTLFVANGLHTGQELFFSDGTASGTHLVLDLAPGYTAAPYRSHRISYTKYTNIQSSLPNQITAVGGDRAVFVANDGTNQAGLFTTDGTASGTQALTTGGLYAAQYVTAFGESALFAGTSAASGGVPVLWITDGTSAGTHAIAGPDHPGAPDPSVLNAEGSGFAVVATAGGGVEAFFAGSDADGSELWVTDGTDGGTRLVRDIAPGSAGSDPAFITALGVGHAIFTADDGVNGPQLWITDGTTAGTVMVATIDSGTGTFTHDFHSFTTAAIGGVEKAFFVAFDGTGIDPWVTDGTAGNTTRLLGYANAYAGNFTAFDGQVFFTASDPTHGRELWVTDGTVAGTHLFDDINPGTGDSVPSELRVLGDTLVFQADGGSGQQTWSTDGTLAGTHADPALDTVDFSSAEAIACFAEGTRLLGPDGPVAVEDLREGDRLLTQSGMAVPVVWLGWRDVECNRHPAPEKIWPVRVRAGAFGPGMPQADVVLSPDHSVFVDGVLIPVGLLADGDGIRQERRARIRYFHVELPLHDILLAEGLPVESYLDTGNRHMFAGGAVMALHPDFAALHWENACAPLVLRGPHIGRVRARQALAA